MLTTIQKKVIPKATNSALNRTMQTVVKGVKKSVAEDTGLKQKEITERIIVRKSNLRTQTASMKMRGRYFNLIRFKARQTKKGVKAKAWGKSKLYRGAFIASGRGGKNLLVYTRKGKRRLPLKVLYGPSPVRELQELMKKKEFNKGVISRFDKLLGWEVAYRIKKLRLD